MDLDVFLGIMVSIFTIILLVIGIILGIRLIQVMDKADRILDNVEDKVNTLNGVFNVIDKTTSGLDLISNRFIGMVTDVIGKIFRRKKEEDDYYE